MNKVIKFSKTKEDGVIPVRKYEEDAGLDVFAREDFLIHRGERMPIETGIKLASCPEDVVLLVWPKSGLDTDFGLSVGAGVIDPNYRGEIIILVKNTGKYHINVERGDAFAQLVPLLLANVRVEEAAKVEYTNRGSDGGITRSISENKNETKK